MKEEEEFRGVPGREEGMGERRGEVGLWRGRGEGNGVEKSELKGGGERS